MPISPYCIPFYINAFLKHCWNYPPHCCWRWLNESKTVQTQQHRFFLLPVSSLETHMPGMNLEIPFIKETFNGFGNAIDYLGRYTHRIAISDARIKSVTQSHVTFSAKDYRTNEIIITHAEFIRRFLMHVLPYGFQKIRYYGFLNNRYKKVSLKLICRLTGKQLFKPLYSDMKSDELLLAVCSKLLKAALPTYNLLILEI